MTSYHVMYCHVWRTKSFNPSLIISRNVLPLCLSGSIGLSPLSPPQTFIFPTHLCTLTGLKMILDTGVSLSFKMVGLVVHRHTQKVTG